MRAKNHLKKFTNETENIKTLERLLSREQETIKETKTSILFEFFAGLDRELENKGDYKDIQFLKKGKVVESFTEDSKRRPIQYLAERLFELYTIQSDAKVRTDAVSVNTAFVEGYKIDEKKLSQLQKLFTRSGCYVKCHLENSSFFYITRDKE